MSLMQSETPVLNNKINEILDDCRNLKQAADFR